MNAEDLKKNIQPDGTAFRPGPASGERFPTDEMLTPTELAVRLKTAIRTIEKWRQRRILLAITIDKVVLFYWPSVVARLVEKYQDVELEETGLKADGKSSTPRLKPSPDASRHPLPSDGRGASPRSGDGPALAARVKKLHRSRS